jgi:type II secretory pathway pseudopilin PulG
MRVKFSNSNPVRSNRRERGYMLLILMFFVAVLTISMMTVLPKQVQQMKRDNEEEMIHRGTEYARAIKKYYKKFNRYPNSLQDLEDTNNIRFLRRRYKDPLTKDGNWRLLHITDVQQGVSNPNFGVSQGGNFNPTQGGAAAQSLGGLAAIAQGNPGGQTPDGSQPGGASTGIFGSTGSTPGQPSGAPGQPTSTTTTSSSSSSFGQTGQTYGAGGIVGVASMDKDKSIRVFGQKANYNKWMFIYDPSQDRGTLLKGPYNPQAFQGSNMNGATNVNGLTGQPSATGNTFGPNSNPQQQPQSGPGTQMPPDQNAPPQ